MALPEGHPDEGDIAAAEARRCVEERRSLVADDPRGQPGEVLEVAVERDVGRIAGAEIEAMGPRPLDGLDGRGDPARLPREAKGGDRDRVQAGPPQGGHRVVAANGEATLAVGEGLFEEVEDPALGGRHDRLSRPGDVREPVRVALAQHRHQAAVQVGPLRGVGEAAEDAKGRQAGRDLA